MKDKEKYEIAVDAWNEYIRDMNAPPSYVDWLKSKITPAPQEWECIKEFPAKWGLIFSFGNKYQQVFDGVDFNDFPNHFKKVEPAQPAPKATTQPEPAPKAEAYTMAQAVNDWERWSIITDPNKFVEGFQAIIDRMKAAAQTETRYRGWLEYALNCLDINCPIMAKKAIMEALGK